MLQEFEDNIEFMLLPNIATIKIKDGEEAQRWKVSFRNFIDGWFDKFIMTDVKSDVPAFIPGSFKADENEWIENDRGSYRIWQNMDKVHLLCLDFDSPETRNGKSLLENAKDIFKDHEYFVHSTHSRTKDNPDKYRMILKLEHPIPVEEWTAFVNKVIRPLGADNSCSNPSRGFYFPSCIDKHNPQNRDKFIEPYSEYNEGRSLTIDFVEKIAKDYQEHLKKTGQNEELKKYVSKISDEPRIEGKRHPAGGIVTDNVIYSQVDTSYDAYVKRHMKSIEEYLVDGLRHNFALSAIMREFQIYKDMVDVNSLVLFLYKAAEDFSDSYLYMEGSPKEDRASYTSAQQMSSLKFQRSLRDTPSELNEMISSAVRQTSNMTRSPEYFTSKLDAALRAAEHASQTNNWIFRKPKRMTRDNSTENKDPLEKYLDKNKDIIQEFYSKKDWNSFVHNVLSEVSNKEDIYYSSQVVMKVIDDFYRDVVGRKIESEPFNRELVRLSKEISKDDKALKISILSGFQSYKDKMSQLDQKSSKPPHP